MSNEERQKLLQYEVLERIGRGTFGSVHKIRRRADNQILVWKEVEYGDMCERERSQLVAEVNILRELNHPHVVRYVDRIVDHSTKTIYIVTEYCDGGDLAQVIKRRRRANDPFLEDYIWKALSQVADALSECHRQGDKSRIVHRDLKPANMFLDGKGNIKLGDFGLSRRLDDAKQMASTHVGTPYYMSPEQVDDNLYNEKSDMWSLGAFLYEMCCLRPPFRARDNVALAVKIRDGRYEPVPSHYSGEMSKMIERLLCKEPSGRPSVSEIRRHVIVASHLREERVACWYAQVLAREQSLLKKDQALKRKEQDLEARERRLAEREQREQQLLSSPIIVGRRKLSSSEPTVIVAGAVGGGGGGDGGGGHRGGTRHGRKRG